MRIYLKPAALFVFVFSCMGVFAQTLDSTAYKQYTFIRRDLNKVENDSSSLDSFYEKLYLLEQKKNKRVNITQVGDSHIQADHFSGSVRQKLQLRFGNAGRGTVFPYRTAKSNEPMSYKSFSNTTWQYKRNVFYDDPLPVGLAGFTIETKDSTAELNVMVRDQPGLGYCFTKFTLFHEKSLSNYDITVCDDNYCERTVFHAIDKSTNPFVSEVQFDHPVRQVFIRNSCADTAVQKSTRIYGMLLENDSAGVLYNMIGVNGAEYRHYTMSKYFSQQFSYLNSDLVIISLGTNEAYAASFDKAVFYRNIDSLVTTIRLTNPGADVLLTTPPDSYRRTHKGRVKNPDVKLASETIAAYAKEHNIAYWNLYEIMGGFGSMGKWYAMKLSAKDRVHYSAKGYQIQADLFYNALIAGYEAYKKRKR
ncbi:MAG: GDSL-type esterase/lipase family protein [Bacteroidia bacterium]